MAIWTAAWPLLILLVVGGLFCWYVLYPVTMWIANKFMTFLLSTDTIIERAAERENQRRKQRALDAEAKQYHG